MRNKKTPLGKDRLKSERIDLLLKTVIICLFISGASVFSYPFISDVINNFRDQLVIDNYKKDMKAVSKAQQNKQLQVLQEKNKKLLENKSALNIPGMGFDDGPLSAPGISGDARGKAYFEKHVIGAIFIPSIQISLPLFDETTAELLEKGATVLQGSSFPIGGTGTHAVITGHSGLPNKKMFTDLEKLKKGDLFFIEISGEKLAYQVTRFETVLPTELDSLKIDTSSDLVTLVTCTPYMVNTHRLLVTGTRVPIVAEKMAAQVDKQINQVMQYHMSRLLLYAIGGLSALLLILSVSWHKVLAYRQSKRHYDLVFYVRSAGAVLRYSTFYLEHKRGKRVLGLDGKILSATSDDIGSVSFAALPGGKYTIHASDGDKFPSLSAYVSHLTDERFTLKSKKCQITVTGQHHRRKYRVNMR